MIKPIGIELKNAKKKKYPYSSIKAKPRDRFFGEEDTAQMLNEQLQSIEKKYNNEETRNFITLKTAEEDQTDFIDKNPEPIEEGQLSVDVYQSEREITIVALIAGVDKENIHIAITDDVLTIKGHRAKRKRIPQDSYLTEECFWGYFSRSIILPAAVDKNSIKADFTPHGVLTVTVPKIHLERTKIIKIN